MFKILLNNIFSRYTAEELTKITGEKIKTTEELEKAFEGTIDLKGENVGFYYMDNKNNISMEISDKAEMRVSDTGNIIISRRLTWIEKILLWINKKIKELKQKLMGNPLFHLAMLPLYLLIAIITTLSVLRGLFSSLNPINILKTLIIAFITLLFGILGSIIGSIIGAIFNPIINKIADNCLKKEFFKDMIVGYSIANNEVEGTIVLTKTMRESVEVEIKKSLIGQEKTYLVIKEGRKQYSIKNLCKKLFLPYYILNRQYVIIADKDKLEELKNKLK